MKKILFAAVALVAMASCATDEVVSRPDNKLAIEFDNAFVENSTRAADINKDNLANFGVYGSVINSYGQGMIFANKEVAIDSNGKYTYQDPQYWIEGANYDFLAFAPFAEAKWAYTPTATTAAENGTISFNNKAAQANQDFLFAYAAKITDSDLTSAPAPVAFTFNHMLSRVKFTITNGFTANSNIKLDITNLTITNAHSEGTLAIKEGVPQTWAVGSDVFARNFGSTTQLADDNTSWTTEHFYLIPANAVYTVTFDVTVHQAGIPFAPYTRTATLDLNLEMGKSYNVKATLDASNTAEDGKEIYPIEFTVNAVEDWEDFGDVNAELSKAVSTTAELAAAVAEGGAITLANNLTLTGAELNVAANKEVSLNLNGKTLTVNALDPIKNNGVMKIANGKVAAANGENTRRCIYNYGEMTINGVEFVQTYDKKGAAINNEGKMIINDATVNAVFYSIWNSGANAELIINDGTYTTTNNVDVRDEWAYAVTCRNGAKMTINGGSFVGNHGVISAEGSEVVLNGGIYHCTATYTGNSDWTLYAADGGSIRYNAAACTVTSANPSGATYGNVTTF